MPPRWALAVRETMESSHAAGLRQADGGLEPPTRSLPRAPSGVAEGVSGLVKSLQIVMICRLHMTAVYRAETGFRTQ